MDMSKLYGVLGHLSLAELKQTRDHASKLIAALTPVAVSAPVRGEIVWRVGDLAEFDCRGKVVQFRIKRINMFSLSGRSLDGTTRCRATPSLCRPVTTVLPSAPRAVPSIPGSPYEERKPPSFAPRYEPPRLDGAIPTSEIKGMW